MPNVPFYEMFDCADVISDIASALKDAAVITAVIDSVAGTMKVTVLFQRPLSPVELSMIEDSLKNELTLNDVTLRPQYPPSEPQVFKLVPGAVILGRKTKKYRDDITRLSDVKLDLGKVTVEGEVFANTSREIPKARAWVLSFDLTDFTGSIRVSKFLREDDCTAEIIAAIAGIEGGKHVKLTVSGRLAEDRYSGGETILEPENIVVAERTVREDTAAEKRVELHLHTCMSNMDALTDVEELMKRAELWGHKAVAVTDHGVAQAFPDAMKFAGDKIKVLYGVEGYYFNDVDSRVGTYGDVYGEPGAGEIVVFDIETTGLSPYKETITEIGAVKLIDGVETERFQTFANPGKSIPDEITRLTGITDADVKSAPSQAEAVKAFLDFAGGSLLCAHNAAFDIGFIYEAAERAGIAFSPAYIDTLALARALFPEMKTHKLDDVARRLKLPEFNHHRASDDAAATAQILICLFALLKEQGVSDLAGINGFVSDNSPKQPTARGFNAAKHITILVKNQAGVKNLYKIITKSHLEHYFMNPVIPKSVLTEHREGLIIGSACEAGEVYRLVIDSAGRLEQRRLADFYDYFEIMPVANNRFLMEGERARAAGWDDIRDFNRRVIALGEELGRPVCATGDVHFLDPEDEVYRHILLNAKGFEDADKPNPLYFRTTDEMLEEFAYLGKEKAYEVVVTNTNLIADLCETVSPLPPKGKLFSPKIENSAEDLKNLVYSRLRELYGENPPEIITRRVETEMGDILGRGYDVIYMSAQKLVSDSLAHGYLVGSRGSVGSSIVAYLAGITEVNSLPPHYRCPKCLHADFEQGSVYGCGADMPDAICPQCGEKYKKEGFDIPFETFLGFGGDKVPDIDLNFSGEYQANAHRYTNELFGSDHVFRAGTIGTIADKTAYGYVKKYAEKTGRIFSRIEESRLALGCVGVKRATGQHPGGLVVIPQDMEITDFCPAQHPADDKDGGIITTHFEYHCMEDNLLKLDELGHDDPTMIKMLEDLTGVNAREIPLDDAGTMSIFTSPLPLGLPADDAIIGETGSIGIPEFGTGFTRGMLSDTKPKDFDTLVRLSGFSHGTDVWVGNAKDIITTGKAGIKETIGCRDDIMLHLISEGMDEKRAFKIMESVRKGRGLPSGAEEEMLELKIPDWYIESCKKIKYLFPKAHAVAYVMMAFRIAWFKLHYPLAYYSAYFYRRSQKDSFDAKTMTRGVETVQRAIKEINALEKPTAKEETLLTTLEACYEFYLRGFTFSRIDMQKSDPFQFSVVDEKTLCPPFVAISGLGETAAMDIASHRSEEFISIDDFAACCPKVNSSHIADLQELGVFGDLPETMQLSLF